MNEDEQRRQNMREIYDGNNKKGSGIIDKAKTAYSLGGKKAKAAASKLGKAALRPLMTLVAAKLGLIIAIIVVVLLVVLFLMGILAFILLGPESVRGMITQFADDLWTSVKGVFYGQATAQVKEEQILQVAEYLDNMGYKLEGYGFGDVERDENGKIKSVEGPYILAYLAAENKTYMIANDNFNFSAMFENLSNIFDIGDGTWGDGMIVLNRGLLSKNPKSVNIDRVKKIMEIRIKGSENSKEEKVYEYNLDGWMGRYGKPIEFLLALHVGTMAPDLAYEVAVGDEFNTKVYVKFKKVGVTTKLSYTYNGKKGPVTSYEVDRNGNGKIEDNEKVRGWDKVIQEATDNLRKENSKRPPDQKIDVDATVKEHYGINLADIKDAQAYEKSETYYYYKPYIRAVTNHWFRDLDFSESYRVGKTEGTATGKYKMFDVVEERDGDIFQVKEPKIVGKSKESKIFADEVDEIAEDSSNSGASKQNASASQNDENKDNNKSQDNSAEYEGYKLDKLFEQEYNIADGISGVSEEKRKVNAKETLQYGITMLENVHSEDAACILRDLKRYMSKRGFTFKDEYVITDPSKVKEYEDDRNLEYGGTRYSRPSNSGGTVVQKPLGGILDGTTGGVEMPDNYTIILHHKGPNCSDGFETGATVKSPGAGTVVAASGDTIKIKLTTAGAEGKTITISGFKVDSSIKQGSTVKKGQKIGVTGDGDITITMVDEQGKPVSPANYLPIISATDNEVDELARLIQAEGSKAMPATAWVILHRVASSAFPNNIHDVIFAPGQFKVVDNGSIYTPASPEALNVARNCLAGTMADPVAGKLKDGESLYFLSRTGTNWTYSELNSGYCFEYGGSSNSEKNVYFHTWGFWKWF